MPFQFYFKQLVLFEKEGVKLRGRIVQYFEKDNIFRINTSRGDSFLVKLDKVIASLSS
ncbi:MAG: hypothetical protein IPO21_00955 [Bacteroidales bacterium]|nr:hypothetical protein [Bacteroidales bacterium]